MPTVLHSATNVGPSLGWRGAQKCRTVGLVVAECRTVGPTVLHIATRPTVLHFKCRTVGLVAKCRTVGLVARNVRTYERVHGSDGPTYLTICRTVGLVVAKCRTEELLMHPKNVGPSAGVYQECRTVDLGVNPARQKL